MSTTYTQAELSAKTVKDLKAILSELKLSGEGKKADLVTRILEHQGGSGSDAGAGAASSTPAAATTEASAEPASSSSAAEAAAISGGAVTSTAGLSAAGTGEQTTDGSTATDAPAAAATEEAATAKEEEKLPLPASTDKNDEAERRLNRLKRFGNPDDIAKIERMEKFGTKGDVVNEKSISALDSELSKKRPRTEKAGPQKGGASAKNPNSNDGKPDFKRQKSGNGKAAAAANGKGPQSKGGAKAAPPALSPEEEEKRRKRAERFNAAS